MAPGTDQLPWRGPGPGRPTDLALPPDRLPLLGPRRRLRKRWRYVGVFAPELMLCAARVQIGPLGLTFWAVLDRSTGDLFERTRKRPPLTRGEVWHERAGGGHWPVGCEEGGAVTLIDGGEVRANLAFGEGRWVESVCPNGEGGYVWTRKRIAPVECEVTLPGERTVRASARAIEDESAGYHPRHTVWQWSAGVGTTADGLAVGWNLVSGVNDPERNSERAIWVDGETVEPGPVSFAPDLAGIGFADGSRLQFSAEAERRDEENLPFFRSSYRQPFGTFTGSLPGIELAEALGVMEHHDALW